MPRLADDSSRSPRATKMPADDSRAPRWVLLAGLALIALQLLTFDVMVERHARDARAQAAQYVAVTLQQPQLQTLQPAAPNRPLLMAGN